MNIVICGAGQVGTHAAEKLCGDRHNITVIDIDGARLRAISDTMDVATCVGNCAEAEVLREANASGADLLLATTDADEVNLLAATIGKKVGAGKTIARVHHGSFFENRGIDYERHLDIDRLICPEFSTAQEIASQLRNPGALAIENFARGAIQMQQFPVSADAAAIGTPLSELELAPGTRLAAVRRDSEVFIPDASTTIRKGDTVILVGNEMTFQEARRLFHDDKLGRRKVVLMGGTPMAVWLCRTLHDRNFAIRLFEIDKRRAQSLAQKLDWVTVICANPMERAVAEEEHLAQADVFVSLRNHDADNIIASVAAKTMGVTQVIAVVQSPTYAELGYHVGVDRPVNPSRVAADEIIRTLEETDFQRMRALADGVVDAYQIRAKIKGRAVGHKLRDIRLSPNWIVAAVKRGDRAWVPAADDTIEVGDTALLVGRHGEEKQLKKLFVQG